MKTWLLPESGQFYKANLHCHSTVSDGKWSPERIKEEYMARGYSVVAYSDHDVCVSHNELTDENFLAITAYEANIKQDEGVKFSFARRYHLNCFARSPYADGKEVTPAPDYQNVDAVNAFIARLREAGFLVCYNHPNWSLQTLADYGELKGLFACEIYNHSAMLDGIDADQEQVYDALLRRGNRLFCVAADDNHDNYPPDHPLNDSFGGFTVIKAPRLAYDDIFAALERGDFYASMGPEIRALYVEDGDLCIETSPVRSIHMTNVGRDACVERAARGSSVTSARFPIRPDSRFIRLQITDWEGMRANTNAYFLDDFMK